MMFIYNTALSVAIRAKIGVVHGIGVRGTGATFDQGRPTVLELVDRADT